MTTASVFRDRSPGFWVIIASVSRDRSPATRGDYYLGLQTPKRSPAPPVLLVPRSPQLPPSHRVPTPGLSASPHPTRRSPWQEAPAGLPQRRAGPGASRGASAARGPPSPGVEVLEEAPQVHGGPGCPAPAALYQARMAQPPPPAPLGPGLAAGPRLPAPRMRSARRVLTAPVPPPGGGQGPSGLRGRRCACAVVEREVSSGGGCGQGLEGWELPQPSFSFPPSKRGRKGKGRSQKVESCFSGGSATGHISL